LGGNIFGGKYTFLRTLIVVHVTKVM
jgi:hypothetical protein